MPTFGIDVATSQQGLDFARACAEGAQFAIVKAGGFNTGDLYSAPFYHAQIDRAIAAGMARGHYWLIGGGLSPEAQADWFVDHLYRFDAARDVLALDNERLDGNGTFWKDAEVARFLRRVQFRTGIAWARLWKYAGAADTRTFAPWSESEALGVRNWWAAYGDRPTGHTPDHTPDLRGSISEAHVHQFSSRVQVAGFALDGNYSAHDLAELFGGAASAAGSATASAAPAAPAAATGIPRTGTEEDGVPGVNYWKRYQVIASRNGYTGKIDGDPGVNSHRGFARFLNSLDFPGYAKTNADIDGKPGSVFYTRLQLLAQKNGYTGRIDGDPGVNTYKGVAHYLNTAI
ncbi:GH25 family lysozyme [Cryobacterium sp. 10S3]|uniref:GH25 family lysozyme n=1 Tax=Cryobacterium sp. 10S3 TaxID=3048582 RepID=UPI002AC9259F|nr:GH25 family lysozyme [Cryobacterium sp. 10S3]MEB0286153.1 GH25 family lysozyme [Cryobacterium sp. 10S3]WPX12211.1 GH25 family lysozyme [Cryobacterium sp. 10S3]